MFPHAKKIQLTLSHICISVLVLCQYHGLFGDFVIFRNVLLFPILLMCTRHSISERLRTYMYLWFQPGSVKFILFCKYSCIPFMPRSHLHIIAVLYEPRKEVFTKLSGAWLPRGSYGVYMAFIGNCEVYVAVTGFVWHLRVGHTKSYERFNTEGCDKLSQVNAGEWKWTHVKCTFV